MKVEHRQFKRLQIACENDTHFQFAYVKNPDAIEPIVRLARSAGLRGSIARKRKPLAMSQEDRDWYRQERKRRKQLVWNDQRGELEFDHGQTKRRGWRKLRRLFRVPDWIAESFRLFAWVTAFYGLWWIYRHLIEPYMFR